MNDTASAAESKVIAYQEALQVLRLSPDGLRRLADLDEAIAELESARRSLLADRLESIRDALDAARKARGAKETNDGEDEKALPPENGVDSTPGQPPQESPSQGSSARNRVLPASLAESSVAPPERSLPPEVLTLQRELSTLRAELAELRRAVAGYRRSGGNGSDAELQQVQRRLSYLEAEIESREI